MFGRSARVRELFAQRARLDAELLREVGAWATECEWTADAAASPTSWLMHHVDLGRADAARWVRSGRLVHGHAATAQALDAGEVSASHVDVMACAAANRESVFDEHEQALLDAARSLPVEEFRTVARRWRQLADDVVSRKESKHHHEARHLSCSVTFSGCVRIDGMLDPHGGEVLLGALDALMSTDRSEPAARRRADALVALAGGQHADVHVELAVDQATLRGTLPDDLRNALADLRWVGPIARDTILRLSCDCHLGRIVRRGPSEVLDVGRRQRLVTPAQRRALELRDGGCVFPGCGRPTSWCDAHHLEHWARGGSTDLGNLALLCRLHHMKCHEGGWTLLRHDDGSIQAIASRTEVTVAGAPP